MNKFIIGTFAILGWAFYVLSGGADFVPEERVAAVSPFATPDPAVAEPVATDPVVARAETASLTQLSDAPRPATAEPALLTDPQVQAPVTTAEPATAPRTPGSSTDVVTTEEPIFASLSGADDAALGVNPIREVSARAVNMRDGPGTDFTVLDTLPQGTQAEIMARDGTGWVRVFIPGTGMTGWMAERLLTEG